MSKIIQVIRSIINIVLYPLYRFVRQRDILLEEFNLYRKNLQCPYNGYLSFAWLFLHFPEYRTLVYHRVGRIKHFYSLLYKPQVAFQIDTPKSKLGSNLMIWHGFSTIINAQMIGRNCTIWHQVTIGNKLDDGECKPIIGDNVKICAGATIIGNIKIGSNSIIGAGSVVVKDVPENVVVGGVPAVIIRKLS